MAESGIPANRIDTSKPHPARMYDYWLGGRDNYEVDRLAAEHLLVGAPVIRASVLANRAFMRRAVRTLTADFGVRQFVDIGTGIPTSPNAHEIAQSIAPQARVAYVDNDPIVGVHGNARLRGTGATGFVLGDLREPLELLAHPGIRTLIDFDQPVALMLVAVLHFVTDEEGPAAIVAALRDALAPGSFLVLSHGSADQAQEDYEEAGRTYQRSTASLNLRPRARIEAMFDGFDLVEPGLVSVADWRPEERDPEAFRLGVFGGVGRKR
ncbi:MAG: SAM-dependent methyltransferase [Actinocrinis sp.]